MYLTLYLGDVLNPISKIYKKNELLFGNMSSCFIYVKKKICNDLYYSSKFKKIK